jgi:hypothetical protein
VVAHQALFKPPSSSDECLRLSMEFSQHALEKCALYGVDPELVQDALASGATFLDLNRGGSRARVFEFLDRPWVAVLTPDDRPAGPEDHGCF